MKYNQYDNRQNVLELQTMLRANHLLEGGIFINPDGIFDSNTTEAVKLFQRQNGMKSLGLWTMPHGFFWRKTPPSFAPRYPVSLCIDTQNSLC